MSVPVTKFYNFMKWKGKNPDTKEIVSIPFMENPVGDEDFQPGIMSYKDQEPKDLFGITFQHLEAKHRNEFGAPLTSDVDSEFYNCYVLWPGTKPLNVTDDELSAMPGKKFNYIYVNLQTEEMSYCRIVKRQKIPGDLKSGFTFGPIKIKIEDQRKHFAQAFDPELKKIILESKNRRDIALIIPYLYAEGTTITTSIPWVPVELYKELMEDQIKDAAKEAALQRKRDQQKIARDKKKAQLKAALAEKLPAASEKSENDDDDDDDDDFKTPEPVGTPAKPPAKKVVKKEVAVVKRERENDDDDGDAAVEDKPAAKKTAKKKVLPEPEADEAPEPAEKPVVKKPRKIAPKKVLQPEEMTAALNATDAKATPAAAAAFSGPLKRKSAIEAKLLSSKDELTAESILAHVLAKQQAGSKWKPAFEGIKTFGEAVGDDLSGTSLIILLAGLNHFGFNKFIDDLIAKTIADYAHDNPSFEPIDKDNLAYL